MFEPSPAPDELIADVAPLAADEDISIEDLTEREWDVFANALHE